MNILIIGLGSIAGKHIDALRQLRPDVSLYALRSGKRDGTEPDVTDLFHWDQVPSGLDLIMICNPTNEHYQTIEKALEWKVPLFIEKPPFMKSDGVDKLLDEIERSGIPTYTAFNMRFLPVLQWLNEHIHGERVIEVQAYCGSYLPDWRPGRDYRKVYSASSAAGGGVHLDLIHELDYIRWIFGDPLESYGSITRISGLELDSPDCAHYWLRYEQMVVSVLLNYYRRDPKRTLEIVCEEETWYVDLLAGTVENHLGGQLFTSESTIQETYLEQMRYVLKHLDSGKPMMNDLKESCRTLALCLNQSDTI